jgi:adenylate cyclase
VGEAGAGRAPTARALDIERRVANNESMSEPAANEQLWRELLTGEGSAIQRYRRRHKHIPGKPRCKACLMPLSGPVSRVVRLFTDFGPSTMNPRFCNQCEVFVRTHPGGAEIELTLLFADIRGSTRIAEQMPAAEFRTLLNRFYDAANRVLIDSDALVDKLVGDEVIGLYLPVIGADHPRKAALAARDLLLATGHGDPEGPWVPVGAGVHTGNAFVGGVGSEATVTDFTAIGDAVNVAARLASIAAAGEVLISESAFGFVSVDFGDLGTRQLEVKGRDAPVDVRVLQVAPARVEIGAA